MTPVSTTQSWNELLHSTGGPCSEATDYSGTRRGSFCDHWCLVLTRSQSWWTEFIWCQIFYMKMQTIWLALSCCCHFFSLWLEFKKWTGLSVYVYMYMYKQISIYLLCVTPTLKTFDHYNFNNYGTQLWWNLGLVKDNLVHGLNWLQKKWLTYFFYVSLSELIVNYGLSFWYWKVNPVWKCLEPVFFF